MYSQLFNIKRLEPIDIVWNIVFFNTIDVRHRGPPRESLLQTVFGNRPVGQPSQAIMTGLVQKALVPTKGWVERKFMLAVS